MEPTQPIALLLKEAFNPTILEITDNSWRHAGHAGNPARLTAGQPNANPIATHIAILIVAAAFEGQTTLQTHRAIHHVLKPAFTQGLHALELKAYSPERWQQLSANPG